jgi:hypothetical protein
VAGDVVHAATHVSQNGNWAWSGDACAKVDNGTEFHGYRTPDEIIQNKR